MAGDCCAVIQMAKSEMISLIERTHPISTMEEEKKPDNLLSKKDFKILGLLG